MHLKRYTGETVKDALKAVRTELGPEALVLTTRLVPAPAPRGWFGSRLVEITAAANRPPVPVDRQPAPVAAPAEPVDSAASQRSREIAARLTASGLDSALANVVAKAHPPEQRRGASTLGLRRTLAAQLASLVAEDRDYAPVEVFVGAPGVGKTTSIVKIAAQELACRGNRLGLVAADAFRPGAVEQLRSFASVLGSPLAVARTPYDLLTIIESATAPILVDTAGRSASGDDTRDMLDVIAGRPGTRVHLVAEAGTSPAVMEKLLARFAPAAPSRLLLTKVDEAGSLAPLLSLLRERQLPLSYLGTGQQVPEDLEVATPRALAARITGDAAVGGAAA